MVNLQVLKEKDTMVNHSGEPYRERHSSDPLRSLARRVAIKLEEGNFKGAVRVASSEDTLAEMDEATILALRAKHPPPHPNSTLPPPPDGDSIPAVSVTEREVVAAICSFPNGSVGEPDSLHPQHLQDLTSPTAGRSGDVLLQTLTSFTNLIPKGDTPHFARSYFFGASLITLDKKDGGVHLLAVGCTLCRLAAKCGGASIVDAMRDLLVPLQLGYGAPSGAEAVAHPVRQFLFGQPDKHVLLKLDFKNAFN